MNAKHSGSIAAALLAATALAGCGSGQSSTDRVNRASSALEACRDHDGVAAFDDDAIICRDQTSGDARGREAVEACRDNGGVAAFDDDIVICGDQTFRAVAEG